jgi:hypothetical protein
VALFWSSVVLTFLHSGWMAPELSLSWQTMVTLGITVGITGIICYAACVPFMLVDWMEKKRKSSL